jgi:hypothetical protein
MATELPKGIVRIAIATGLIDTPFKVIVDNETGEILKPFENWAGDGTVIDFSAADWDVEDARASTKEHAHIFADDAAREVIDWIFVGNREPTKGTITEFSRQLRVADGKFMGLRGVSYEIVPQVLTPGQAAVLYVDFTGDNQLATADLSNITVQVDSQTPNLQGAPPTATTRRSTASLAFPFTAPIELGAHALTIHLPGISDLEDYFLVISSN